MRKKQLVAHKTVPALQEKLRPEPFSALNRHYQWQRAKQHAGTAGRQSKARRQGKGWRQSGRQKTVQRRDKRGTGKERTFLPTKLLP